MFCHIVLPFLGLFSIRSPLVHFFFGPNILLRRTFRSNVASHCFNRIKPIRMWSIIHLRNFSYLSFDYRIFETRKVTFLRIVSSFRHPLKERYRSHTQSETCSETRNDCSEKYYKVLDPLVTDRYYKKNTIFLRLHATTNAFLDRI